ncbi:MAG: alpha/beta hydrolase, partial [Verrucomicrobiaceae bacterium]
MSPRHLLSAAILLSVSVFSAAQSPLLDGLSLPDPLTTQDGKKVASTADWETGRRGEILELFRSQVYGRAPIGRPEDLHFRVEKTDPQAMGGAATLKQVAIEYGGPGGKGKINLVLFVPNERKGPAPAFLLICNRPAKNIDPTRQEKSEFWPAEQIIARGYAAAAFQVGDVDPDKHDGFKNGVHGIYDPAERKP